MEMTPARVDAILASSFNVQASRNPAMRQQFPNGCRPADAALMSAQRKRELLNWYADNADERTSLYTRTEAARALVVLEGDQL